MVDVFPPQPPQVYVDIHPVRSSPPRWISLWMALRLNVSMFPAPWTGKRLVFLGHTQRCAFQTNENAWFDFGCSKIKASPCWTGRFFKRNIRYMIYFDDILIIYIYIFYIHIWIYLSILSRVNTQWIYLQSQLWRQGLTNPSFSHPRRRENASTGAFCCPNVTCSDSCKPFIACCYILFACLRKAVSSVGTILPNVAEHNVALGMFAHKWPAETFTWDLFHSP